MDLRHLGREIKTALEIAIVTLAPTDLVESLALAAGLLDALGDLPDDAGPALALGPKATERSRRALADWHKWEQTNLKKASA
jgi:hypothetical protein